ncbi:MAG: sialidase family protein [Bryobacteraceae bacterium]
MRAALFLLALPCFAGEARIVDVHRIWDQAPHNAFTDLARFRNRWYCVFREGSGHGSPDGRLRVITSRDGARWESAALIESAEGDLRDAKISVTPDGRLMLMGAVALRQPAPHRHQSLAWFSHDGRTWGAAQNVGDPDFWLWRVTWHKGTAYGFGYNTNRDRNLRTLRLYASSDGRSYKRLIEDAGVRNSPGESAIRFDGERAIALLRRDPYGGKPPIPAASATALIGSAVPPYLEWTWKDTGVQIGGPNFIAAPGSRWVAAVRLHKPATRTALCWLDPTEGKLTEFLELPSKGDCSYAGLVMHQGLLWVSYYSSHEGKTSIYLAKVRLP